MVRIPVKKREKISLDLSPLIDVIFILIIFIVLIAKFINQNQLDIDVPKTDVGRPMTVEALVINVTADGAILVGDQPVPEEGLTDALKVLKQKHDRVVLMADRETSLQKGVSILTAAKKAGFEEVSVATEEQRK
jgi:biopolymer transport protein ExbD